MANYKATINVNRELWDNYKAYCQEGLGVSISERIRDLIKKDLEGKIALTLETDSKTDSRTDSETENYLELRIAQIYAQLQDLIQTEAYTILNQTNRSIAALADYLGIEEKRDEDLKYLGYGKKTDGKTETETEKVDGLETDGKTDILDGLSAELAERPQLTYSDREVFDLEPSIKSKTTIYRYRTGKSRPKDATFLDRWRVSPGGSDWMKVEKEVDFGGFNKETQ